ncbi:MULTISPECIES: SDR family oxidoreductase [unclassified Roseovarius]|uniref:SDR family oxidoreductase n=1 Tax=unclassified Roseovarius TaxID=2614913 RepID=UPI00273ECD75|nr:MULTISPECIES: SDR family oxidoreductase [unclassified Roseovarius]
MTKTLLSFGHGYSAQALARVLIPQGWTIYGTTRNPDKAEALEETGIIPVLWPDGDLEAGFAEATHMLVSAGPREEGDPVYNRYADKIKEAAPRLTWFGYLSTTGVYGNHNGEWTEEEAELRPSTERGIMRKEAEERWQAIPDLPVHIFRLAGIYGPGRGPFAKVRQGTARRIIKKNQIFSRIHVDDIAQVLAASIAQPNPGRAYNVCDDEPAPPQDVIGHAAELLGMPLPPAIPFEEAEMSPMARSFYSESKRISNRRIKSELGVKLRYPTYRDGLAALLAEEG